jgi:Predicted permeases
MMKAIIKRYKYLIAVLALNLLVIAVRPGTGIAACSYSGRNLLNFLVILAPVFILIGLMDIWVERELMIRIMGNQSGLRGTLVAFLLGSVTAVPLYALLPVAAVLLRKGSRIANVLVFLCASAAVRIPLLLFELSSLGWEFTLVRCAANIVVVFAIAFIVDWLLSAKDKEQMYANATEVG